MISIIIPVYNQADKLAKCLASILSQTFRDLEVIVVNDGSKDDPARIVSVLKGKFSAAGIAFRYLEQENKGAPAARNRGLSEARGDLLFFCDADAVLKPETLKKMFRALENNPEAGYAYSSFLWGRKLFRLFPFDAEKLRQIPYIHTMSLIRREDFPAGGWDESIKKLQDWDLWLTMLDQGHVGVFINEVLFRIHTGGAISNWLPSFAYKVFPFLPAVKKYRQPMAFVKNKHRMIS